MEPFVWREKAGTDEPALFMLEPWLQRYSELTAGFTSRQGGVSGSPYGSLNCGLHVQDDPFLVVENRRRLAGAIGMPFEACTYAEQVHGAQVAVVDDAVAGAGREAQEASIAGADALVTNLPGVTLNLMFADCVPLYFYDPIHRAVGLAHAGWKGTVSQIAMATVTKMAQTFNSKPEELYAAIGPCIDACCYEVDEKVAERVRGVLEDIGALSGEEERVLLPQPEPGKYRLSLKSLNRLLMTKAGILSSRIEVTKLCTSCDIGRFFSHRKEGGRTGRMVGWIALK
jgi:YfiH family protein